MRKVKNSVSLRKPKAKPHCAGLGLVADSSFVMNQLVFARTAYLLDNGENSRKP